LLLAKLTTTATLHLI